jgi:spore coat protein H
MAKHPHRPLAPTVVLAHIVFALSLLSSCASNAKSPGGDGASEAGETGATPCGTPDPSLREGDLDALFAATSVPTFDFYLPQAEWENLKVHAREEQFVPVQACYQGRALGTVGLRFKGSYGTLYECFDSQGNMTCPRLSMKVKFDEYVEDQRFFGLKRLAFNAHSPMISSAPPASSRRARPGRFFGSTACP